MVNGERLGVRTVRIVRPTVVQVEGDVGRIVLKKGLVEVI
jgi:hypothetical protein